MSTRSGKRIHASLDSPIIVKDAILQSERKTRNKKRKKNVELFVKIRQNYVSYPDDEGFVSVSNDGAEAHEEAKKTGKTRRNTLKEHNVYVPSSYKLEPNTDNSNIRKTRSGKKRNTPEDTGDIVHLQNHEESKPTGNEKKMKKKSKYNKDYTDKAEIQVVKNVGIKKNRVKKNKRYNSIIINDEEVKPTDTGSGEISVDSFYSAAGSPVIVQFTQKHANETEVAANFVVQEIKDTVNELTKKIKKSNSAKSTEVEITDFDKENSSYHKLSDVTTVNNTVELATKKRRKSVVKNSTVDNIETNNVDGDNLNTTFDKIADITTTLSTTTDVSTIKIKKYCKKNSSNDKIKAIERKFVDDNILISTFDDTIPFQSIKNGSIMENNDESHASEKLADLGNDNVINSTVHKTNNKKRKSSVMNSTFEKVETEWENNEKKNTNCTFVKDDTDQQVASFNKKSHQLNRSPQRNVTPKISEQILTSTLEISSISNVNINNLDSTFNYDNNTELNTTFDTENKILRNSDIAINVTFNKPGDNSSISITSDESRTENILNHTPVLINSSIDESIISENKASEKYEVPITPMKREGTFTKEGPDIVVSPKFKATPERTPAKHNSSPGCTPFPSRSSQKETIKMNVTRSIENSKSLRRSSLTEMGPRQSRVMFCSPVNNPAIISQMKRRVIKSNLKGSNKSFIFENSVYNLIPGLSETLPGRRKRSLTEGAVVGTALRAKRKRLADEQQHSVDRLSRPRTLSAAAKLPDPGTPSKNIGTPSKVKPESKVSRTKLPNFAALHQKQFAKMESLDECQERKAKRAKQLLTPTGSVGLLERTSPKDNSKIGDTPPKPAPPTKEPAAKQQTPSKPKVMTLGSLSCGYTRFGFKLNNDANPFSVIGKTEDTKENRPKSLSRRTMCPALPSLAGATACRKDAAKQTVMREKSFTEKRDVKRKESRTVIKGVRTNRRFELQMKLRNINA